MQNKTCVECKHLNRELAFCRACGARWLNDNDGANCQYFEKKTPPTNGDRIRQMSNEELIKFKKKSYCFYCAYHVEGSGRFMQNCDQPQGKTCIDGFRIWLNAPAKEVKHE